MGGQRLTRNHVFTLLTVSHMSLVSTFIKHYACRPNGDTSASKNSSFLVCVQWSSQFRVTIEFKIFSILKKLEISTTEAGIPHYQFYFELKFGFVKKSVFNFPFMRPDSLLQETITTTASKGFAFVITV